MLSGVAQQVRHLHQATIVLVSIFRSKVVPALRTQHFHSTTGLQWPSAVAFRMQSSYGISPPSEDHASAEHTRTKPPRVPYTVSRLERQTPSRNQGDALHHSSPSPLPADDFFTRMTLKRRTLRRFVADPKSANILEQLRHHRRVNVLVMNMAGSERPQGALHVLLLVHELECCIKMGTYESVAHQLADSRAWRFIPSLVDLTKRQSGRVTVRLLNWVARAFSEIQDFAALDGVLGRFRQEGLRPNRRTFHILVSGHLRNRDLARARKSLMDMQEAGIPIDASTHTVIVSSYRSLGPDPTVQAKALEILSTVDHSEGTTVLNSLLQLSLDTRDMPRALGYLALFEDLAAPSSGRFPASGASTTRVIGERSSPRPNSFPPTQNAATYTILLNFLAKEADMNRALQVLQRMKAYKVTPDSSTVAALIRVYFATGHANAAIRIMGEMCRGHNELFRQLEYGDDIPNIVLSSFSGLTPTTEVFNAFLQGTSRTHGIRGVQIVLRIMASAGVQRDQDTVEILLTYLRKLGHTQPRTFAKLLRQLSPHDMPLVLRQLHSFLWTVVHRGQRARSRKIYEAGDDKQRLTNHIYDTIPFDPIAGIPPTPVSSYRALMRPFLLAFTNRRVLSDRVMFALRIRQEAVLKRDLEAAEESFATMVNRGIHPNEYHFAALMQGYAIRGDMAKATAIMQSAAKSGIRPNLVMYTTLIAGYAARKNPRKAFRVFREMVAAGIQPDAIALHVLIRAHLGVKARRTARRILFKFWPDGRNFESSGLQNMSMHHLMEELEILGNMTRHLNPRGRLSKQTHRMLRWKIDRLVEQLLRPKSGVGRKFRGDVKSHNVSTPTDNDSV